MACTLTAPIGFAVIDKPAGLTSHACVARIRRLLGIRRIGHGGTLDPAVTGVLPIAVGQATRLLPYLPGEKTYRGVIQLGISTNTDDLQGEELSRQSVPELSSERLDQDSVGSAAPFASSPLRFQRSTWMVSVLTPGPAAASRWSLQHGL